MRRHSRRRPHGRPQRSILLPHARLEKGGNQLNYFRWFCELFSEHQPPNYASLPPLQITPKAVEVKATYITSNPLHNRLIFRTKIRLHRPIFQPGSFPTPIPCGVSLTSFALTAAAPIWAALQFPQGGGNGEASTGV